MFIYGNSTRALFVFLGSTLMDYSDVESILINVRCVWLDALRQFYLFIRIVFAVVPYRPPLFNFSSLPLFFSFVTFYLERPCYGFSWTPFPEAIPIQSNASKIPLKARFFGIYQCRLASWTAIFLNSVDQVGIIRTVLFVACTRRRWRDHEKPIPQF